MVRVQGGSESNSMGRPRVSTRYIKCSSVVWLCNCGAKRAHGHILPCRTDHGLKLWLSAAYRQAGSLPGYQCSDNGTRITWKQTWELTLLLWEDASDIRDALVSCRIRVEGERVCVNSQDQSSGAGLRGPQTFVGPIKPHALYPCLTTPPALRLQPWTLSKWLR
jgi:hypothetical protein